MKVNQVATVIVGIVNREQEISSYRVSVRMNGLESDKWAPSDLAQEEKREKTISFQPVTEGDNQKVEFYSISRGRTKFIRLSTSLLTQVPGKPKFRINLRTITGAPDGAPEYKRKELGVLIQPLRPHQTP